MSGRHLVYIYIYIYIYIYGLIYLPNSNGLKTCRPQKKIIRAFKIWVSKIEISSNLKIVNFLDVTFDLNYNSLKPF